MRLFTIGKYIYEQYLQDNSAVVIAICVPSGGAGCGDYEMIVQPRWTRKLQYNDKNVLLSNFPTLPPPSEYI